MDNKILKNRIIFIFTCFCFFFLVVIGKAFKVQLIDASELIARSNSQFLRTATVYPKRGNIYDRDGNPLALNIQTYSIFTIPRYTEGDKKVFKTLSKIVPELPYQKIIGTVKKRKKFTWLARKLRLSKEQVEEIKKLKGVFIEGVPERIYPNHELASQIVGFVGLDNKGLAGLEYMFDEQLKGQPTTLKYVIDNKGRPIKFESHHDVTAQAKDIFLTIDNEIQSIAEKHLKDAVLKHNADKGGVGIMDATTGEILAMANYPTFDPNNVKGTNPEARKLSFAIEPFEPGSSFKIFTVASALEHKIAKKDSTYFCEQGKIKIDGHWVSEAESHEKFEWLSVADILRYSSNVGTTKIAFDLKFPKFKETLKSLNIGEKTGIEVPGESRGIFTEADNVTPLSLSNISFGQGVATTGIQMLAAMGAIANGGYYIQPTLIKYYDEKVDTNNRKARRVFSESTSKDVTDMLVNAVEMGTGTNAKIPFFKIAGKTATAQRVDRSGGYKGYVSGFVGFPVNVERRFVVFVYIDNPKSGGYYGNVVAAPVFKNITEYLLYKNKDVTKLADKEMKKDEIEKITFDQVQVTDASTRIISENTVPNFIGLDKISTIKLGTKLNLQLTHKGMGVVRSQFPAPGSEKTDDLVIKLDYSPPNYE